MADFNRIERGLVERLALVKEGEFQERVGATPLRLIRDVRTAAPVTLRKGSVTRDDLRRDFLKDALQADPVDYLRTAIDIPGTELVPLRYFADKAKMRQADLQSFITSATGTAARKRLLIERIALPDKAYMKASGQASEIQKRLLNGKEVTPVSATEARVAALAVAGLPRPLAADASGLRTLLLRCLDLTSDDGTHVGKSEVRKAVARLDELCLHGE